VDAGWEDTEALEYLRFTRAEITELIRHLGLAEWAIVKRARGMQNKYFVCDIVMQNGVYCICSLLNQEDFDLFKIFVIDEAM